MGFTVSFVLSPGSDALLPPSPCGSLMRAPVGRTSPHDLTPDPGRQDHTTSPSAHIPIRVPDCWRALAVETEQRRCQRRVVSRLPLLTVSRPAAPLRVDAVAAIASQPASRDDRETPLVAGGMGDMYGKTELL